MDEPFDTPDEVIEETHAWGPDLDLGALVGKADQAAYVAISRTQANGRPGDYQSRVELGIDNLTARRFLDPDGKPDEARHIEAMRRAIYHELRQLTLDAPDRYLLQFRSPKGTTTLFTRQIIVTPLRPMTPDVPYSPGAAPSGTDPMGALREADAQHALPGITAVHQAMQTGANALTAINSVISAHMATLLGQKDAVITALTRQGASQEREIDALRRRVRDLEAEISEIDAPTGRRRGDITKAMEGLKEGLGPLRDLVGWSSIPEKLRALLTPENLQHAAKPEFVATLEMMLNAQKETKAP